VPSLYQYHTWQAVLLSLLATCLTLLLLQLCDLYENDSIFDKFDCCINGKGDAIATGSYNNLFRVFGTWNNQDLTLEASRDPMRKRLQTQSKVRGGEALGLAMLM
jgi:hypothetical protein